MTKLTFRKDDVMRVVQHMMAAPEHARGYGHKGEARPQIILVKDDGIYLMSNGRPWDELPDSAPQRCFAAYAVGYDLNTPDLWEKTYHAVGGDDFAEYLDLSDSFIKAIQAGDFTHLEITVSRSRISIALAGSKATLRHFSEADMVKKLATRMKTRILFIKVGKILQTNPMKAAQVRAILDNEEHLARFSAVHKPEIILNTLPAAEAYRLYREIHPAVSVH